MRQELQQSVVNAVSSQKGAASVAVGSMGAGSGAYFELLSPIVGLLAALAGLGLSIALIVKTYKEIKLKDLQIKDFEENH
jgi:hypothetical protein